MDLGKFAAFLAIGICLAIVPMALDAQQDNSQKLKAEGTFHNIGDTIQYKVLPAITAEGSKDTVIMFTENLDSGAFTQTWTIYDDDPNSGYHCWGITNWNPYGGSGNAVWCARSCTDGIDPTGWADYANDMYDWMYAGPYDLSDAYAATFSFQLDLDSELNYDYLFVGATNDMGSEKTFHGQGWWGDSGGYIERVIDMANTTAAYTPTPIYNYLGSEFVWIGFLFYSDYLYTYDGAYIDNIQLTKWVYSATPTPSPDHSATPTRTPTSTMTPTSTSTPTDYPTFTPSNTPTNTPCSMDDIYEAFPYNDNTQYGTGHELTSYGALTLHYFCSAEDNDWSYFSAQPDVTYIIATSNLGAQCDTAMYLYDNIPQILAQSLDVSPTDKSSRIEYVFDPPGVFTYWILVRSQDGSWGHESDYTLRMIHYTPTPTSFPTTTPSNTPTISPTPTQTPTCTGTPPLPPVVHTEPPYSPGTCNTVYWNDDGPQGAVQWLAECIAGGQFLLLTIADGNWVSVTEQTFSDLQHSITYNYRVKARDSRLQESAWSDWVSSTQDAVAPSSSITSLPDQTYETLFDIHIDYSDDLSGVSYCELYYQHDGSGSWINYDGTYTGSVIWFDISEAQGTGLYEFDLICTDVAGNTELLGEVDGSTSVFNTPTATSTSTSTPTATQPGDPTPTNTPTPTRTPTTQPTDTRTPTPTPQPATYTPSKTPTITPTATPTIAPLIMIAGYMQTRLQTNSAGNLNLIALVTDGEGLADVARVEIYYQGLATGVLLLDDGAHGDFAADDGVFGFAAPVGSGLPPSRFLLEIVAQDASGNYSLHWPYLSSLE